MNYITLYYEDVTGESQILPQWLGRQAIRHQLPEFIVHTKWYKIIIFIIMGRGTSKLIETPTMQVVQRQQQIRTYCPTQQQ